MVPASADPARLTWTEEDVLDAARAGWDDEEPAKANGEHERIALIHWTVDLGRVRLCALRD